jgi:hypothetical protein
MSGFSSVYSIAEGFEGDMGKEGTSANRRTVNSWKNANLPWSYKLDKTKCTFRNRPEWQTAALKRKSKIEFDFFLF